MDDDRTNMNSNSQLAHQIGNESEPDRTSWGHTDLRIVGKLNKRIIDHVAAEGIEYYIVRKTLATCRLVCRTWNELASDYLRQPWGHRNIRFPTELFDAIIDCIAAAGVTNLIVRRTLVSCRLVCRAWNRRDSQARKYLKLPWGHRNIRIPVELCETIIDYVAAEGDVYHVRKNLSACNLVCRAWLHRARFHLCVPVHCRNAILAGGWVVLTKAHRKQFILQGREPPLPHFFTAACHMPTLSTLFLDNLDIQQEHPAFFAATHSLKSIMSLELRDCGTRNVAQLGRFVTSFPSLSTLEITWSETLTLSGLPDSSLRRKQSKCSLKNLSIQLAPNTYTLLGYFIKARPFVTNLRCLILQWDCIESVEQHSLLFRGIRELFIHCGVSLEWLSLEVKSTETRPLSEKLSELIPLSSLHRLKELFYDGTTIAKFALQHLETTPKENQITTIYILQDEGFGKEAEMLDLLLTGKQFQSLQNLKVHYRRNIAAFPRLQACGVNVTGDF